MAVQFQFISVFVFVFFITSALPDESLKLIKEKVINGEQPIKGVNLGGWLVAERWMTEQSPIWDGVPIDTANQGEYKTMQYLGHANGDVRFKEHRGNFITEQDFAAIKAAHLNTVRIPIGYWITGFDHSWGSELDSWKVYAPGALEYLDKAVRQWAPKHGILVLISMHGAKGSQNGKDHSAPSSPDHTYWSQYKENVNNTLDCVEFLARRYNNEDSFLGIGLLNEPSGSTDESVLKQYYYDAYHRVRSFSNCLLTVSPLLSQQSADSSDWKSFMSPPAFHRLRHEWHRYQIWGFEGWDANRLITYAKNDLKTDIKNWKGNWLFIGEWSLASSAKFSDRDLKTYANAQLTAFNNAHGGWTYWTWKFYNENSSLKNGWSMKSLLQNNVITI